MTLRKFEDYIKRGWIRKQNPDLNRANSLIKVALNKREFFELSLKKINPENIFPNYIVESCYDILMELLRAKMIKDGFYADNSHEAEISYMNLISFSESEIRFMDLLRYNRNGIKYYGTSFSKEYAEKVLEFLNHIFPKLEKILEIEKLIWYACYGSNILERRFMLYIHGGKDDFFGVEISQEGCTNKNLPKKIKQNKIPYKLYFAKNSQRWNGGIGFVNNEKSENEFSLGRTYLITEEQFNDIKKQEGGELYSKTIELGMMEGYPIKSFTNPTDLNPKTKPSPEYLKVIINGLKETYPDMQLNEIANYLLDKEGIKGNYSFKELSEIINTTVN